MKKILITGGAGFIGSNSALTFARHGWQIYLIDNLSRKGGKINLTNLKKKIKFKFYNCDIENIKKLSSIINKIKPQLIIHCAGQVAVTTSVKNPRFDFNSNATGTLNVLESIRLYSKKSKLIFLSTNKVYGDVSNRLIKSNKKRYSFIGKLKNIDENYPLDLHSPYGCSKGAADQYVRDYSRVYGLDTIVLRMSCIYGNMQFGMEDQGWITWLTILSFFNKKIKIFGDGKQVRDVLFVSDLVQLFLKISKTKKNDDNIYNIGGGFNNSISILELIEILNKKLNKKNNYKNYSWRPGDQKIYISNISKVKKSYKWYPKTKVNQGLDTVISWIKENESGIKKILKV